MSLDIVTALAIMGFTSAVAGGLLLISWLQHRKVRALVPWALTFVLVALGIALMAARGAIPDVWTITVANAVLALAYGSMWSGARLFEGRPLHPVGACAGAVIWLLAASTDAVYASPTARLVLMTAIGMVYSLLAIFELLRPRDEALASRWLIVGLLLLHTVALPLRIPLAGSLDMPLEPMNLVTFVTFESVVLSMCGAYLFGSLVKERIAQGYRRASLVDPLTGVPNRRAFHKQGVRIMRRSRLEHRSPALLLFDLDHFKSVNDTLGHPAGDGVLNAFCRVAEAHLRPTDFFARLGGEEFVCLLPDTSRQDALAVAERVRSAFEATGHSVGEEPLVATVSAGVAVAEDPACDLAALLARADRALYRAKRQGRNRVESAGAAEPAQSLT